ncbi:MAG: LPS translocon maturation chaperone LptM [Ramlibacter sp.]
MSAGVHPILVSPFARRGLLAVAVAAALAGCGQKGPLVLPTGDAAAGRASLPETLAPSTAVSPRGSASAPGTYTPPSGTAAPIRNP